MKRYFNKITLILSLCLAVVCVSPGLASEENVQAALYQQGMEVAALLTEMARNEDYVQTLATGQRNVLNMIAEAGEGDRSRPAAVYRILPNERMIAATTGRGLPEQLQSEVYDRIALSFKTMLNSPGGADCAAAANLLSARTLFVEENFTGRELWLFTYKDAFPVVVSFISGEEGAAECPGTFVFRRDLTEADIEAALGVMCGDVEKILDAA